MFEKALEQLLLQYLDPYVEGISRDKLHLGVFSGSLELKDLKVKSDALALLGWEGFRVRSGTVRLIKISIPWSKLYTGKLRVVIDHLHLEVESISDYLRKMSEADLIKELRQAKQKSIEVRMNQLRSLVESSEDTSQQGGSRVGLVRKVINNITVMLSDVKFSFSNVNNNRHAVYALEFPRLAVVSTDQTFRELDDSEVVHTGQSLYKKLRLQGLGMRMSTVGTDDIRSADYLLTPISASLQLAHVPTSNLLSVKLEVATEEKAEATMLRSQMKHLRGVQAEMQSESQRLQSLLVPACEEQSIYMDAAASKAEYSRLYERHLLNHWNFAGPADEPLTEGEEKRRQLLEDALSVRLLALERWKAHRKVEALHEEVSRRQSEVARQEGGRFRRFWTRSKNTEEESREVPWLTDDEREQFLRDLDDESKVESIDLPQRVSFEFMLGRFALGLADDRRRTDEAHRQLLDLDLQRANLCFEVRMAADHRGQDSAEWSAKIRVGSFYALHSKKELLRLNTQSEVASDIETFLSEHAAELVVESKLEKEQNLLQFSFNFTPVEIHFLPGIAELLLEFVRAPAQGSGGAGGRPGLAYEPGSLETSDFYKEQYVEMSKTFMQAHGDRAKEVVEKVYERIPDKMHLSVKIASPIVHVPVVGLGTATFSLGRLEIVTPQPCEYHSIDLAIELNDTTLQAVSVRNEQFDMIQPVPVMFQIEYRSSKEKNTVNVKAQLEPVMLSLAPQALQILLATPGAIASIMYPSDPNAAPSAGADATSPKLGNKESGPAKELISDAPQEASVTKVTSVVHPPLGSLTEVAREALGDEGDKLLEAAADHIAAVRAKQFQLSFTMQLSTLEVVLADSIMPVMRLQVEFLQPGFVMAQQSDPYKLTMNINNSALEAEILNPRHGAWEPLVERFHLGLEVKRSAIGNTGGTATNIGINGHEPMLLNFTPTAVQRASWIIPLFLDSLRYSRPAAKSTAEASETIEASGKFAKYRVVNLCGTPIELHFTSRHKEDLVTQVQPTGSEWQSLDKWILPHFATSLVARPPSSQGMWSEHLSLERKGTVDIPCTGCVAELFMPDPSHFLLLLASPLRMHNRTDLTLFLRFHDACQHDVIPVDIHGTMECDAAIIGHKLPEYKIMGQLEQTMQQPEPSGSAFVLPPNGFVSVPVSALIQIRQTSNTSIRRTWFSVKPACTNLQFCAAIEAGDAVNSCTLHCPTVRGPGAGAPAAADAAFGVHLACDCCYEVHPLPSRVMTTTIALQPTLALLNAVPAGNLTVRYAMKSQSRPFQNAVSEVTIAPFTRYNVYRFAGVWRDGLSLVARWEAPAPWSNPVSFGCDAFRNGSEATQSFQLCQEIDGAPACVNIEALNDIEVRLSCPNWFVDRSGIGKPMSLALYYKQKLLPHFRGITLLPEECFEETCDLVLRSNGWNAAVQPLRLPPNWSVFPWNTKCGPFVFCIQAEDIAPGSTLGAHCQALTLRSRLVLTNASSRAIELRLFNSIMRLGAGQSIDYHWRADPHQGDPPTCITQFRPLQDPPAEWSGGVTCGDEAAGSTALAVLTGEGSSERHGFEIWSVEVAPTRGALAVSFRQGSNFIAVNRAEVREVQMAIRPTVCSKSASGIPVVLPVPLGKEVPFGWPQLSVAKRFAVEVLINDKWFTIPDVRCTGRIIIQKNWIIAVTRVDARTILSLEDLNCAPAGAAARSTQPRGSPATQPGLQAAPPAHAEEKNVESGNSTICVDFKFSRLGISIIEEVPQPRELLYMHFELIRMEYQSNGDLNQLKLVVSEAQVDCQLPNRVDVHSSDSRRDKSLGLMKEEQPAVIIANCADGDNAFLTMVLRRGATSSNDIVVHGMEVTLDALDVTIDDDWLNPVVTWMGRLRGEAGGRGVSFEQLVRTAGLPIITDYEPPELPVVVQVDSLQISAIQLTAWCSLRLKSVHFLPQYLRTALRLLSFSGRFKMDGARVKLPKRTLPPHRGSLTDFYGGLCSEYLTDLLNNTATMLGKSSVLNLPRVPLKIGMTGVSYMTETFGVAAGEAASLLNHLTFDDEYVAKQRALRSEKKIRGIGEGVVEAGKSLAQGFESLSDVITKPIEGAKSGGMGGFFKGLGQGAVGSLVKPISKMGQAVSDIGAGVAAGAGPESKSMKRRRARPRMRQPRMIFSELGIVRPWCDLHADLPQQLGESVSHGVEEVVQLKQHRSQRKVLLLYPRKCVIADLKIPGVQAGEGRQRHANGSSSSSSAKAVVPAYSNHRSHPADFFDDLGESADMLGLQLLKPINTAVFGVQDISSNRHDPAKQSTFVEIGFAKLKSVRVSEKAASEILLEDSGGTVSTVPPVAVGQAAFEALFAGFRSAALHRDRVANWDMLRSALRDEQHKHRDSALNGLGEGESGDLPRHAGQRILEVFEVERRVPFTSNDWTTPFMFQDAELRWRWLDSTGHRHPHLIKRLPRDTVTSYRWPPCELDETLFHPASPWQIDKTGTDEDGWKYGLAWNSSTWEAKPNIFDTIRRKRWIRTYE